MVFAAPMRKLQIVGEAPGEVRRRQHEVVVAILLDDGGSA
jgi:hypothetical protein